MVVYVIEPKSINANKRSYALLMRGGPVNDYVANDLAPVAQRDVA